MSLGGSTWDTAGTLTLGSDNTFDTSNVTEVGTTSPYNHAWWKFTPTVDADIKLVGSPSVGTSGLRFYIFDGPDEENARFLDNTGSFTNSVTFTAIRGVTYHILGGTQNPSDIDDIPTYQLTATQTKTYASSPWLDDLQDDPDNYLIVTYGALAEENPNPQFQGGVLSGPEWLAQVIRSGQGRRGDYQAVEVLTGDDPVAALGCVISHAAIGDQDTQSWNASTEGSENDGPGACRPLPPNGTAADNQISLTQTSYSISYNPGAQFIPKSARAVAQGPSYGLWFLPVRDNLHPQGVIAGPSPEDYGYPEDAVLEWEESTVQLVGIYLADGDPADSGTAEHTKTWSLNDALGPAWEDAFTTVWRIGIVGAVSDLSFDYADGDIEWHKVPDSEGWDGHGWYEDYDLWPADTHDQADGIVIAWPSMGAAFGDSDVRSARIAVKFVLRAPRFRFVYEGTPTVPPRRLFGRSDGATHGAARVYGGGNTVQSGNRVYGGIL